MSNVTPIKNAAATTPRTSRVLALSAHAGRIDRELGVLQAALSSLRGDILPDDERMNRAIDEALARANRIGEELAVMRSVRFSAEVTRDELAAIEAADEDG